MEMRMTPAEYVIYVFGGVKNLARAIGRHHSTITRWTKPKFERGTGGIVPTAAQALILTHACRHDLDVTPLDLARGRRVLGLSRCGDFAAKSPGFIEI